jgi:hypothetical protein
VGFGYELCGIAQNFVMLYGPWHRILLCAMGHSARFGYVQRAIATDQLP